MCFLCDANDGSVVAGGLKVMNSSHYRSIWWMTAVLKVSLTFEVVTEWWTCAMESEPHHLLFDVILVCLECVIRFKQMGKITIISVGAAPGGCGEPEPRT